MTDRVRKDALYEQLASVGKALASPRRLELLEALAQAPRTVEALARAIDLSVANASAHLQVLRQAGLVVTRKDGTRVWYRLAGDDVTELLVTLQTIAGERVPGIERAARDYLGEEDDGDASEPVSRKELTERIERGDVVVVDVRPAEEYAAGHIPGAESVPIDELAERLDELPDDVEVVAYCRGPYCVLSSQAVGLLREHGRSARRLADGLPEWSVAGLPVERDRSAA